MISLEAVRLWIGRLFVGRDIDALKETIYALSNSNANKNNKIISCKELIVAKEEEILHLKGLIRRLRDNILVVRLNSDCTSKNPVPDHELLCMTPDEARAFKRGEV